MRHEWTDHLDLQPLFQTSVLQYCLTKEKRIAAIEAITRIVPGNTKPCWLA